MIAGEGLGDWDRPPNDPLLRKEKSFTSTLVFLERGLFAESEGGRLSHREAGSISARLLEVGRRWKKEAEV
jgi:hypothetical protein